jgi:hypothetical protein
MGNCKNLVMNENETKNHIFTAVGLTITIATIAGVASQFDGTPATSIDKLNQGLPTSGDVYKGYDPVVISSDPKVLEQLQQIFPNYDGVSCIPINKEAGIPAAYTAALIAGNPNVVENPVALVKKSGEVESGSVYLVGEKVRKGKRIVYDGEVICVGANR